MLLQHCLFCQQTVVHSVSLSQSKADVSAAGSIMGNGTLFWTVAKEFRKVVIFCTTYFKMWWAVSRPKWSAP